MRTPTCINIKEQNKNIPPTMKPTKSFFDYNTGTLSAIPYKWEDS